VLEFKIMAKTKVGVLRGGPSSEYEVSIKTGDAVLKNMPDHYEPVDIFIDKKGDWYIRGVKHDPQKALRQIDVVFNALHGEYGEDGQLQEFLDKFGIPYTGSGAFASRVAMNKALAKTFVAKEGIKTPKYKIISKNTYSPEVALSIFSSFPLPIVVKPLSLGSSVGVTIAKSLPHLQEAIKNAFFNSEDVLIEEFISGREATCGVLENFSGEEFNALPPIEIISKSASGFFDYDAKYNGQSEEICPGRFSAEEMVEIRRMASAVHKILGLRHYSRSDFILHPKRGIFFLEVNTLPGLTEASLVPKAIKASGSSLNALIDHLITLALKK
jgi:D-alanine--D-alanine ligase